MKPRKYFLGRNLTVSTLSIIIILLTVSSTNLSQIHANENLSYASSGGQIKSVTVSSPVYIWFFGFIGNEFYPQTELGVSESTMINVAKNLSQIFGKQRLVLTTAVDEIPLPNGSINKSAVSTIKSYVTQLKQYAGAVYGRLDFYQFNLTSESAYGNCSLGGGNGSWYDCPIYNQSALYINQLGLNGIWFDHPSQYYSSSCTAGHCGVGSSEFNYMMQNLTTLFPNAIFILNQTPGNSIGYVRQINGDCGSSPGICTWENRTYVSPSPPQKSLSMNQQSLQIENSLFPGHVIAHFDAEGPPAIGSNSEEPMSIFADENSTLETSALNKLLYNSTHPAYANETYSMVVPLIGSWTCDCSAYGTNGPNYTGTLYNGLTVGVNARSTIQSIEQVIQSDQSPVLTVLASRGHPGESLSVTGVNFLPTTQVNIEFDGVIAATCITNSSGGFLTSFLVPAAPTGNHEMTVTNTYQTLTANFKIIPAVSEVPGAAKINSTVTVTGNGFASTADIVLRLNGTVLQTKPMLIQTNSTGSFNATYVVPNLSPGTYVLSAKDSNGNTALAKFRIKA